MTAVDDDFRQLCRALEVERRRLYAKPKAAVEVPDGPAVGHARAVAAADEADVYERAQQPGSAALRAVS